MKNAILFAALIVGTGCNSQTQHSPEVEAQIDHILDRAVEKHADNECLAFVHESIVPLVRDARPELEDSDFQIIARTYCDCEAEAMAASEDEKEPQPGTDEFRANVMTCLQENL